MDQNFIEALLLWAEGVVVAEVPLAENARRVSSILEHLCDGDFLGFHHGTSLGGIDAAGALIVATRHEACAGGGADRGNVEIRELGTFSGKLV